MSIRKQWITPAYAGKSYKCPAGLLPVWDHPRVCGEKEFACKDGSAITGSPPRMRGKVYRSDFSFIVSGITPAYAGKRFSEFG